MRRPCRCSPLLKHPLAAGGMPRGDFRAHARYLERRVLRGPRPASGFEGLADADGQQPECRRPAPFRHAARRQGGVARGADGQRRRGRSRDLIVAHAQFAECARNDGRCRRTPRCGTAMPAKPWRISSASCGSRRRCWRASAGPAWPSLLDALLAGRVVRPRYGTPSAPVHLGTARGAPAAGGRPDSRRPQRRHVAAGAAGRPVDVAADARASSASPRRSGASA